MEKNTKTEDTDANTSSIPAITKSNKEENENNFLWVHKDEDEEILKISCCKNITISSNEKTLNLYPAIVGTYRLQKDHYVKEGAGMKVGIGGIFLYQPVSDLYSVKYSWGVSTRVGARWGFIKSSSATTCPDMDSHWQTYDKVSNKWVRDSTLSVTCTSDK